MKRSLKSWKWIAPAVWYPEVFGSHDHPFRGHANHFDDFRVRVFLATMGSRFLQVVFMIPGSGRTCRTLRFVSGRSARVLLCGSSHTEAEEVRRVGVGIDRSVVWEDPLMPILCRFRRTARRSASSQCFWAMNNWGNWQWGEDMGPCKWNRLVGRHVQTIDALTGVVWGPVRRSTWSFGRPFAAYGG